MSTTIATENPVGSLARALPRDVDQGFPRWLRGVDLVHLTSPHPVTLAADAVVVWLGLQIAGVEGARAPIIVAAVVVVCLVGGVYAGRDTVETQGVLWYPARLAAPLMVVVLGSILITGDRSSASLGLRIALGAASALILLRSVTGAVLATARRRGLGLRRALIVGRQPIAEKVADKLVAVPEAGLRPIVVASAPYGDEPPDASDTVMAKDLTRLILRYRIDHVVLIPEGSSDPSVAQCVAACDGLDVALSMVPPLAELFLSPSRPAQVGGLPLLSLGMIGRPRRSQPGKRLVDAVLASVVLLLAAPVMLVVALAVLLDGGRPILFRQRRVGRDGRTFDMLKFRSMVHGAHDMVIELRDRNVTDGLLFKVRDDPRVTRVGRVIRRCSIDELPQLLNVLRGDMSLVGPRPLAVDPDDFGPMDGKRHAVRPGIPGY